eukprot:Rhum_TRINITY_DN10383_c1_g2::Rhum_TRINITY_DN10383_c1_g2_i1::g.38244::m.38244/K20032/ZDHHC13_17, HIP14; palmitoyltransferase ZDHHC13/17
MTDVLAAVSGRTNEDDDVESKANHVVAPSWGELQTSAGGTTPSYDGMDIFEACQNGDVGVVILLWYKGVDVTHRDPMGVTPLHQAAYHGKKRICQFLVDQGANVNAMNSTMNTPIMWAVCAGHYETFCFLASHGANLTGVDSRGYSVLFHAVHNNRVDILNYMATEYPNECDFHKSDSEGHNLLQWAAYKGFLGCCRYLHEVQNVGLENIDKEGRTALHWVGREGHTPVAEYLLSTGKLTTSLTHRDTSGLTAAESADSRFHKDTARMIRAAEAGALPRFGQGREVRTSLLMMRNGAHLRRFAYGLLLTPLLFFYASTYIPGLLLMLVLPLMLVGPPTLDGHMFRGGQPPVRVDGDNDMSYLGNWRSLHAGTERNLTCFATILALQLLIPFRFFLYNTDVYNTTDLLHSNGLQGDAGGIGAFLLGHYKPLYDATLYSWGAAMLFYALCCLRLPDEPKLPATDIETGERKIPHTPGAYCFEVMARKSLRSAYSRLTHRVVAEFDHFSITLDSDVGKGNRKFYFLYLVFTLLWTACMVVGTSMWAVYKVAPADTSYSVCRVIGRMAVTLLPGGDPGKTGFLPTANEVNSAWCGYVCLLAVIVVGERLYAQITQIAYNITMHEAFYVETVPVTGMNMQSYIVKRHNGRYESIFSHGGIKENMLAFLLNSGDGNNSISEVASIEGFRP